MTSTTRVSVAVENKGHRKVETTTVFGRACRGKYRLPLGVGQRFARPAGQKTGQLLAVLADDTKWCAGTHDRGEPADIVDQSLLEGFFLGVGIAEIETLRLALSALTLKNGDSAPGIAVKRVAEPTLELSGPVSLPDGAGTAFYFLRGQHAAKLGRIERERAPVSIFERMSGKDGGYFYFFAFQPEGGKCRDKFLQIIGRNSCKSTMIMNNDFSKTS